jgi:hypothetical protein
MMQLIHALSVLSLLLASAVAPQAQAADAAIANHPGESLAWQATDEGVAFAALVGDRFAEPYMAMVRLPAGLVSPAHTKSANMFGVMISGAMVHSALGADPAAETVLRKGSFYKIPKDLPHVSKCVSKVECVTFLYQDGKFDFLPAEQ